MILRNLAAELERTATWAPSVTLTGPRQSGKTTLCRAVFSGHPYRSIEAPDERAFAREDPRAFLAQFPRGAVLHGCFWRRHEGCRSACEPETRISFWSEKFNRNVARDRDNEEALRALGWRVLVIWECEIRNRAALEECLLDYLRWSDDEAGQSVT